MEFLFEHHADLDRDAVFAFHENPAHLELILADWRPFRLLHHDGSVKPDSEVWIEENALGFIPVALGFRHDVYEPPHRFGEQLIHGPFSRFTHVHEFEENGLGGTMVRDRLDVWLPWQYGGALAMERIVAPRLRRAFALRARNLQRLVADGTIIRNLSARTAARAEKRS